jgi:hypothetical protein
MAKCQCQQCRWERARSKNGETRKHKLNPEWELYKITRTMFEERDMEAEADSEERWINTRPKQKQEPMPKNFSPEDEFRARGMGIRLD